MNTHPELLEDLQNSTTIDDFMALCLKVPYGTKEFAAAEWSAEDCLELSIHKWQLVAEALAEALADSQYPYLKWCFGCESCALCWRYEYDPVCDGCPVKERTGQPSCVKSPYTDTPDLDNAQAEVAFLESLR